MFRRQPLDLWVVVICRFNTVLRVRVILSAGDLDCSFPASCAFPPWFLGLWFNGQFIHRLLCCAVLHWMTVTRKQACWRLTGHQQNDVIRFRGSEWRRRPHECHCTMRHFVWNLYFWRVSRAWPENFTVCQGPFKNCSPYGRAAGASVASAINANICTGFTVILAIQHSHICRRNVQNVSSKRPIRVGGTSVDQQVCRRNVCISAALRHLWLQFSDIMGHFLIVNTLLPNLNRHDSDRRPHVMNSFGISPSWSCKSENNE